MNNPGIKVQAVPPERQRQRSMVVHCGCCCCCCCCLHTVGGLLGAVVASTNQQVKPLPPEYRQFVLPAYQSHASTIGLYWGILGLLTLHILILGVPWWRQDNSGIGVVILGMPFIQLVASLLAMFCVLCFARTNKGAKLWVIAVISFGTFVGTLVGIVLMILLCGLSPMGLFN
jgi:hypothetical protein